MNLHIYASMHLIIPISTTQSEYECKAYGYTPDFVQAVITPHAKEIKEKGIRVVANAGGVNLEACAKAVHAAATAAGVQFRIATVGGDDLIGKVDEFRSLQPPIVAMDTGAAFPSEKVTSMNAYLGDGLIIVLGYI